MPHLSHSRQGNEVTAHGDGLVIVTEQMPMAVNGI
jgi:hypothetical protein